MGWGQLAWMADRGETHIPAKALRRVGTRGFILNRYSLICNRRGQCMISSIHPFFLQYVCINFDSIYCRENFWFKQSCSWTDHINHFKIKMYEIGVLAAPLLVSPQKEGPTVGKFLAWLILARLLFSRHTSVEWSLFFGGLLRWLFAARKV